MIISIEKAIWASFLLSLAVMVMIFCFSAESGEQSSRTSDEITQAVITAVYPDYRTYSPGKQMSIRQMISHTVRKTAHFIEFSMLGFSLMLFFTFLNRKRPLPFPFLTAWIIGALYAGSDELHQRFVSGRAANIADVALDSAGVLFGAVVVRAFFLIHEKKKKQG